MFIVICGEDYVNSRLYYSGLKKSYSTKNYEVREILSSQLTEENQWLFDSMSLFDQKSIFFTERVFVKPTTHVVEILKRTAKLKNLTLIDWENKSSREIRFKEMTEIKEFKLSQNIFKLMDSCYPTNKQTFIKLLTSLADTNDETFIYIMLTRHIRNLILAISNRLPDKMQSWQKQKLLTQSKYWKLNTLVNFYEGLYRIDLATKTNTSPYGIKNSLDILACYYL